MKKLLLLLAMTTALPTAAMAQATDEEPEKVSIQKDESIPQHRAVTRSAGREGVTATLQYVRLPDMKKPRAHHQTFVHKDYLVVVGGLSTGGKPTATAEMINYTSSGHSWTGYYLKNTHHWRQSPLRHTDRADWRLHAAWIGFGQKGAVHL